MPIAPAWRIPIPECSLPTWLFNSPHGDIEDAEKAVLIDADHPKDVYMTRASYRLWSKRFAVGLQKAGLQPGDRVLLFSGNSIFFPVVFMGIVMAGGIFTGANPSYVSRELAFQLKDSGSKFLICAEDALGTGLSAASMIGMAKDRIFVFNNRPLVDDGLRKSEIKRWDALIASVDEGNDFAWKDVGRPRETTCCINYSSGTTGLPKGVEISHYNYVANAEQVIFMSTLNPNREQLLKSERWLCFLPMYHAYGQTFFVVIGPKLGIPVYVMPKYDFLRSLAHVQEFRITSLAIAPPIAVALAKTPAVKQYDLSSVRGISSGAAPLSKSIAHDVDKLWPPGDMTTKQGWGMTELTCSVMGWDPNLHPIAASIGKLLPNCEACIMSDEDEPREVARGDRGELWIRGPNVMKGYWQRPEETAATLTSDGWLKTGDIATVDAEERFYIVDRKKELIKVKGNQVAPAELESVLLSHSSIVDAAVIGVELDGDERPRAYIVRRAGDPLEETEVVTWMDTQVARHKRITGGVVFIESIPKNPSGKILRKELRERARAEVRLQQPRARL